MDFNVKTTRGVSDQNRIVSALALDLFLHYHPGNESTNDNVDHILY